MPSKKKKKKTNQLARFHPGVHYHVYNRTNNREPLFRSDADRHFFLSKYKQYLGDYVDTFAWCLLDNHFHFSIRVKSAAIITERVLQLSELERPAAQLHFLETPEPDRDFHPVIERQFTRLFTAYSMAFNRQYARSGNLFYRPFKRVEITDEDHLVWLVYYIHSNIVKHGIQADFSAYPWSSYPAYLSDKPTSLCKQEVLEWFGGKDRFIEFHQPGRPLPKNLELLDE